MNDLKKTFISPANLNKIKNKLLFHEITVKEYNLL